MIGARMIDRMSSVCGRFGSIMRSSIHSLLIALWLKTKTWVRINALLTSLWTCLLATRSEAESVVAGLLGIARWARTHETPIARSPAVPCRPAFRIQFGLCHMNGLRFGMKTPKVVKTVNRVKGAVFSDADLALPLKRQPIVRERGGRLQ